MFPCIPPPRLPQTTNVLFSTFVTLTILGFVQTLYYYVWFISFGMIRVSSRFITVSVRMPVSHVDTVCVL